MKRRKIREKLFTKSMKINRENKSFFPQNGGNNVMSHTTGLGKFVYLASKVPSSWTTLRKGDYIL